MKKALYFFGGLLLSIASMAQQQRPIPTQFSQSLIPVSEQVPFDNVDAFLANIFNLATHDKLELFSTTTDDVGFTHYKYQQKYKNLQVEGSTVTVHVLNGTIKSVSGNYRSFQELGTSPSISKQQGLQSALSKVNATEYVWQQDVAVSEPTGELLVFTNPLDNNTQLAYKYDVYAVAPLYRADVYVSAKSGEVLFENNRIHHTDVAGSGSSLYNGNVSFTADFTGSNYRLRQTSSGSGVQTYNLNNGTNYTNATDFTSNSANSWSDATGVQAHWGAEKTHAYYLASHNRNSFNGSGAIIKSYVHYSNGYVNAYWDGTRMTYGDGDGVNYSPLVSLDIVGHEITHGVTEYTANLIYQRESGALNESFSDIFGEAIENYATGSNNWQMGTDIGIGGSGAIRSMNNPNAFGDPDTYGGSYWGNPNCGTPTQSNDYCYVHSNSGVQNKWFYILSQGESGTNDIGSSYSVTGIGITKAAKIAYRNLSVYLSSSSNYAAARAGSIQSAVDLYGAGSAEEIATTNAWYAVGVGAEYGSSNNTYCTSNGANSSYEWISNVTIGSFSNSSGASGYTNFTNQTVSVNAGQSYNISLTPSFSGTTYQEYWKIWVDYNADGDFSDAGELVYSGGPSASTVSGTLAVPSTASGTTRMRVSMKWNASQTECESFSYGEVEDYKIEIIGGGGGDTQAPSAPTNLAASGTTQTTTNLSWTASTDNVGVTGYEVFIGGSSIGTVAGTSASITSLLASTTYNMYVKAFDAAGNISAQSNTVTVTTQSAADTQAPTAPGNLSASNITQTSADISWNASSDNVGVVGYDVSVDGSVVGTTISTNYSLTSLLANTTYQVTVTAKDAAGNTTGSGINITTLANGGGGSTVLLGSYFETGWDGWQDGGSDCGRYSGSRSWEGNYSIYIRDNSGTASSMTSPSINLSGYNKVDVEFYFYANSMENNEDFWVRYFNGSSWSTVATYARGTSFNNNTFYVATVTLYAANVNFASNAQFRFQCDASDNSDLIYIDGVTITASNTTAFLAGGTGPKQSITEISSPAVASFLNGDLDVVVYPNPTVDVLNLQMTETPTSISIISMNGQVLRVVKNAEEMNSIDVSAFPSGTYIIQVQMEENLIYKRFIKQ